MARTVKLLKNGADPTGAPDFTLPVSILAQIIESLKVDIVAQTLSTLKIEISAVQTGLVIETNVTNFPSTYPLPDSQVSTLQNITIANIAAGIVFNVNVSQISCALNINNWPSTFPLPSDQVSSLQQITIQNVAAGLYIPINIAQVSTALNISNFPSTYPLPDAQVSTLQQITIQNIAAGLYIPINIAQVSTTINTQDTIVGIAAGVYIPITIHNVESGVIFNINISSISSGVTFNVNITGTPTINVQTSGGANIVIDKLTQGAYTERQSTLANNGDTPTMANYNLTYKRGKFFPRGCRGFIRTIEIYCNNTDSVSHTFTVKLSPMPGMGPVATFTLSVSGGASAAWWSVTVKMFWNYDSLFIWVSSDSDSYGQLAYDTGTPSDYYVSSDEVTWTFGTYRWWFRAYFTGETVGDLPVSGTVNTIGIPSVSSRFATDFISCPGQTETTIITINGAGECDTVYFLVAAGTDSHYLQLRVYCDGNLSFNSWPDELNLRGFTASTPNISLLKFNANGICVVLLTKVFKFRRQLRIAAYPQTSNVQACLAWVIPSLIG